MAPRALITATNRPSESWYSVNAASKGVAEVMLYDEIGGWGVSARQFARDLAALGDVSQINLHIHSPGGDVMEGTAMYNILRGHSAYVAVYVDGLAASMASVIAMAGDVIYMPANALMMIHKPWGGSVGDADDMREYADLLDKVEGTLIQAYVRKSGKTAEEIAALLKQTTWMDGNEAVAAGFADKVLEPINAAAQLNSKRMQEYTNMPPSLNALMNPKNNAPTVPANQPPAAEPTLPGNTQTVEQIRAQVLAQETERRTAISAAFGGFATGHAELLNTCLGDMNCTVEQASKQLLAALGAGTTATGSNLPASHVHVGNGNHVGDGVRASLLARVGYDELQAGNAYNHMSLRELARASLTERGIGVASFNPMQMVGMAFTHDTSDFGNILLDIATRSVLLGWEEAEETFHLWTKKGQLSDFKPAARIGMGEFPSLRQVREGAEYKHITVGDRSEKIVLATYGELFSITRQAIINDDLSMLQDIPRKMGMAAKATIGDLVYGVLTSKTLTMSDGKKLFDAAHNNLFTGAPSAMSIAALSAAKKNMALQKTQGKEKQRTLNIRPAYILTPIALEDKANQLIRSASVPDANVNAGIDNPIRNMAQVIGEPRLDDVSSTGWYAAAKQGSDTIEVAYLNGVEEPYVEQQNGFTVDGVVSKVRIDAGVAPLDFRGLNYSVGE